jgi:hypothetical protein
MNITIDCCKHGQMAKDCVICDLERQLAEREGFYEKMWKDFVSLQRGDFQRIALEAEECRMVKQQLAEREKQIVMLRTALVNAHEFIGDDVESYETAKQRIDALAATANLKGYILCDAKPDCWRNLPSGGYPLYKARTK